MPVQLNCNLSYATERSPFEIPDVESQYYHFKIGQKTSIHDLNILQIFIVKIHLSENYYLITTTQIFFSPQKKEMQAD